MPPERWSLQPLQIDGLTAPIPVSSDGVTIGRDPANTVTVPPHLFPGVSSHHARVSLRDAELHLEDMNSKNKTLVHGKPVADRVLRHGDVFQLGPDGPRFAVVSSLGGATDTMVLTRSRIAPRPRSIGAETMMVVRERLGIPEGENVAEMVRARTRRNVSIVLAATLLLAGAGAVAFVKLTQRGKAAVQTIEERARELERSLREQLRAAHAQIEEQRQAWLAQGEQIEAARTSWERDKAQLEEERRRFETEIARLESDEKTKAGELTELRERLDQTNAALDRYNPAKLQAERLDIVSRVEKAVVLIEASLQFKDEKTGRPVYYDRDPNGRLSYNFDGIGQAVMNESTGSGFCVSEDGWILTNAHVVFRKGDEGKSITTPDFTLLPELTLAVVFSGTATRRPARLVRHAGGGDDDVALIKIEPFAAMPHLPAPRLDVEKPPRGAEVYLIGFPLGKRALQQGDTMIASTFRGIVSRTVRHFIQVDAAVHPGASGGPAIDDAGQILGIVTGMQRVDEVAGSSAIGLIIPIAAAAAVWPPG